MRKKFSETLIFIADLSGKTLTEQIHNFYLHELEPIGLDRVIPALMKFANKSKWPSIDEIKEQVGVSPNNISKEEEAKLFKIKINKLVRNPGGSTPQHCREAQAQMTQEEWEIVNSFMNWSILTNGDIITEERLIYELNALEKHYIIHNKKQSFEKHQELIGIETKSNTVIQPLLDSKFQKMIDEIPF